MKLKFKLRGIIGYYPGSPKMYPFLCTNRGIDSRSVFFFTNEWTNIEGWYRYKLKKL